MKASDFLQKLGITEESLSKAERASLEQKLDAVRQRVTTVQGIKEYLEEMRDKVEIELVGEPEFKRVFFGLIKTPNRKCILLKARLENYLLLLAFISTPDKMQAVLERAVLGMARGQI